MTTRDDYGVEPTPLQLAPPVCGHDRPEPPLVLLGVSGSIAAYKACLVARELVRSGCRVKVILTEHGAKFVGAPTFHALTGETVETELFADGPNATNHIELAKAADLMLVVPATANVVAKLANGVADDLLSTVAVVTNAPTIIAPAMNPDMWSDVTVVENIETLRRRGVEIVEPATGQVVCGDTGTGKLADVDVIVQTALDALRDARSLEGHRVLITAGPTYEAIDSVRFIGNRSSGKMGYALAAAFAARGADVVLVSGPTSLPCPASVVRRSVVSAADMRSAVLSEVPLVDIFIGAAAVSDYRVEHPSQVKIHRSELGETVALNLVANPDILAEVGRLRSSGGLKPGVVLVGFAAEDTNDGVDSLEHRGLVKLAEKGVDLVVVNDISVPGVGFDSDENEVVMVGPRGVIARVGGSKRHVAHEIVELIVATMDAGIAGLS